MIIAAPPWPSPTRSSSACCSSTSAISLSPTSCNRPVDYTPVYPREAVKRALKLSATALILVYNHPSGDPTPSRADIQMTQAIVEVARPLGIAVHDHIIVDKEGHAGLKGLRLIQCKSPYPPLRRCLGRNKTFHVIRPAAAQKGPNP